MTPEEHADAIVDTNRNAIAGDLVGNVRADITGAIREAVAAELEACAATCDRIAERRFHQADAIGSGVARVRTPSQGVCQRYPSKE